MKRKDVQNGIKKRSIPWDVIVIGGGASGLGCAIDAASRGYDVLLLEKHDFAKGTSSRSTKLVHGGVRYLQNGDISLVIEALKERGLMLKNAPHLVRNQSFVIPSYEWWNSPFYGLGLKIYDMMAGKMGLGPSTIINRAETLEHIPNVKREGLQGGVIYYDGQFDDARMAISMAQTVFDHGGLAINYFSVDQLLKTNGMISGVMATDRENNVTYEIHAKVVINATGVSSDAILQMDDPKAKKIIIPSQGVHIVLDKKFLKGRHAIMVPNTSDGRVMFAVPWHNKVVVGTTDTLMKEEMSEPVALEEEIDFLLTNAKSIMAISPKRSDIKSIFAGLRPLAVSGEKEKSTKEISRHHQVLVTDTGLVSIVGGKWTTYRKMAEDTIDIAAPVGGLSERDCVTQNLPIHGSRISEDFTDPLHVYGADKEKVLAMCKNPESISTQTFFLDGQIRWAVEYEMAQTIEDVLARRTRILFLDAAEAILLAPQVAKIMKDLLKKDEAWEAKELESFNKVAKNYLP